jgi:hypothetical protein
MPDEERIKMREKNYAEILPFDDISLTRKPTSSYTCSTGM